jgi:hypothetical protein
VTVCSLRKQLKQAENSNTALDVEESTVTCSASIAEAAAKTLVSRPTMSVKPIMSFFAALMDKLENTNSYKSNMFTRDLEGCKMADLKYTSEVLS